MRSIYEPIAKNDLEAVPDLATDYEALSSLGDVLNALGELQGDLGAERRYRDALALKPGTDEIRAKLAGVYSSIAQQASVTASEDCDRRIRYYPTGAGCMKDDPKTIGSNPWAS